MKKIFVILTGILLMGWPILARDFSYTYQGYTLDYTVISDTPGARTCMLKEGDGQPGNYNFIHQILEKADRLVIPSVVNDGTRKYTVVKIGDYALYGCWGPTQISIPSTVTYIGKRAFDGAKFTSVALPGSVRTVGEGAFCNCGDLKSATLPDGLPEIAPSMFAGCPSLEL